MQPLEQNNLRERLAALQHHIWASWMQYLFSVSIENQDGSMTIPREKVDRWKRQVSTLYDSLPPEEKESDKEQADKILILLDEIRRGLD